MNDEKKYILDDPKNVKRIIHAFYVLCAGLVAADFFVHRHTYHDWEKFPAFYAVFGFVACVILVFLAILMRKVVMRKEDYYEPVDAPSGEDKP